MQLFSFSSTSPIGQPQVGDLATARLVGDPDFVKVCCRIERIAHGTAWIRIIGLDVPWPYRVGDDLAVNIDQIIDWN